MLGNVAPVPGGIGVQEAGAHRRPHRVRHPDGTRARHGDRVPQHHLRDPADLRLLHAALAAGEGLRVGARAARRA